MEIRQVFFTENPRYKDGRTIKPKGIMVHSTGANNPNLRRYVQPDDGLLGVNPNGNDWNRSDQSLCVHNCAVLKPLQVAYVDLCILGRKNVVEAALRHTALQRHLAAFKPRTYAAARAGFLPFMAFAGGLPITGGVASALAVYIFV